MLQICRPPGNAKLDNQASWESRVFDLHEYTLDKIRESQRMDIDLYEYAKALYAARIAKRAMNVSVSGRQVFA